MDLEIYAAKENKKEPVRLALETRGSKVAVVAVDSDGNRCWKGDILSFQTNGTIRLATNISSDFGFDLDSDGRLKLT